MLSKKKKIFILVAMVALLVVTGYLNIVLNNNIVDTGAKVTMNFYDGYRKDRQETRDSSILLYESIIASDSFSAQAKANAEASLDALIAAMNKESLIEGMIRALGFEDVVLTISNTSDIINVVVKAPALSREDTAKIVNIVRQQTGKTLDEIKIIPSKE